MPAASPMADPVELLLGVTPVVEAIASRLEAEVPVELELLEERYGHPAPPPEEDDDPDLWRAPRLVARSDRQILEPDDYPALLVVPQATGRPVVQDLEGGSPVLVIPYSVRVWGFVRHWSPETVAACRNRLALGVEQAVFRNVRLDELRTVDLFTWSTSYSDVGVDDVDQSTFAGWWIDLLVHQREQIGLPALAPAGPQLGIEVTVHPADA